MAVELTTDRVKLIAPAKSDAIDLYYLRTNPTVNKYIQRKIPQNISDVEEFIKLRNGDTNNFYFTIKILASSKLVGTICLKNIDKISKYAEVGYELFPQFHGQGIMKNALSKIIDFAFEDLKLETLEAFTHVENFASRKLLDSFNFKVVSGKSDPDNLNNVIYFLKACT